jgi:hypothetical protein
MSVMKYIKKQFLWYDESSKYKYKKGDYILLKKVVEWNVYPYAKIISRKVSSFEIQSIKNGVLYNFWINNYHIDRRLEKCEIETYNAMIDSTKYNL